MALLDDLLNEADQIIEKKASKNIQEKAPEYSDNLDHETAKFAEMLLDNDQVLNEAVTGHKKEASVKLKEMTPFEKVARSVAICEAVQTLADMEKLGEFVKVAKANGYSDEQVEKFVMDKNLAPIHKYLDFPERLVNE